jgi:hypothetical protein
MRALQEWMGRRDIATTQRYADYAPSPHVVNGNRKVHRFRALCVNR